MKKFAEVRIRSIDVISDLIAIPCFFLLFMNSHQLIPYLVKSNLIGSPWGAGTFAGPTGGRQPSPLELEVATLRGKQFYGIVSKVSF